MRSAYVSFLSRVPSAGACLQRAVMLQQDSSVRALVPSVLSTAFLLYHCLQPSRGMHGPPLPWEIPAEL